MNTTSTSSDASGAALDVVPVARVVQQRRVEAVEQAVVDHDLLAAAPLLGRACRGTRSRRAARRRSPRGRSPRRRPRRPSCCGRSRGRGPGSASYSARIPMRGPSPPRPPRRVGPDGRLEAAGRVLDLEAVAGEDLGDPGRGADAPRRPAPGSRGSGGTGRGSRRGPPRRRRRAGPWHRRAARRAAWRIRCGHAISELGGDVALRPAA